MMEFFDLDSRYLYEYTHLQSVAAMQWSVVHGLGRYPTVNVIDSSGKQVFGQITHISKDSLLLDFSAAFSGSAVCN